LFHNFIKFIQILEKIRSSKPFENDLNKIPGEKNRGYCAQEPARLATRHEIGEPWHQRRVMAAAAIPTKGGAEVRGTRSER
jgi:hypothetical protein